MKKLVLTFALLSVLSVSGFAEGDIPLGGKTCPQGQICVTGDIPLGGRAIQPSDTSEDPLYIGIFNYIKSIFG